MPVLEQEPVSELLWKRLLVEDFNPLCIWPTQQEVALGMEGREQWTNRCGEQPHSLGVSVSDPAQRKTSKRGKSSQNPATEETKARTHIDDWPQVMHCLEQS